MRNSSVEYKLQEDITARNLECCIFLSLASSIQVANFVDESLNVVASKLEHAAQSFPEFQSDNIVSLHVCSLYTCARLDSGALYWW